MTKEFDSINFPLDSFWFDSPDLRDERKDNYQQEIANILESECDKVPEIKEFKSLMRNFFIGRVELTDRWIYIPQSLNLTEENADEVYTVIENHIDYPDDENLKACIFTQETNKEIWDNLSQYGLILDNKYKIINNADFFMVWPLIHISEPDLFVKFLRKIKICDQETILHIDTILWSHGFWLEDFFLSWNNINDSEEVSNFIIKIYEIWEELERLEIEEYLINMQLKDLVLVISNNLLEEYINFKRLWFSAQIYPDEADNFIKIPKFIYDFLDVCNRNEDEEDLHNCVATINKNIKKSLILLSNIRNQDILFKPIKEELELGIRQLIEYINDNPYIETPEKSKIINPISNQAKDLNFL